GDIQRGFKRDLVAGKKLVAKNSILKLLSGPLHGVGSRIKRIEPRGIRPLGLNGRTQLTGRLAHGIGSQHPAAALNLLKTLFQFCGLRLWESLRNSHLDRLINGQVAGLCPLIDTLNLLVDRKSTRLNSSHVSLS